MGRPSSAEEDVGHLRVVVLAGVDELTSAPAPASARWTGADLHEVRARADHERDVSGARRHRGSVQRPELNSLRARSQSAVLADARRAPLDTRALPARRRRARPRAHAGGAEGGHRAGGDRDRRRLQRGAGDRAAAREPARARLPGREARARRHLRRVDRPHARAGRAVRGPRAPDRQPARRQGGGAEPGRARDLR